MASADLAAIQARSGRPADAPTYRYDAQGSGRIDADDMRETHSSPGTGCLDLDNASMLHGYMKKFWSIIVFCVLAALPPARALIVLDLVETVGETSSIQTYPGGTIDLMTRLTTDQGESVGGVWYTVAVEVAGWTLLSRDYYTYGWSTDTDFSVPVQSAGSKVIGNDTFDLDKDPLTLDNTADFYFDSVRLPELMGFGPVSGPGWTTVEVLQLLIPLGTPIRTTYTLTLTLLGASDAFGDDFDDPNSLGEPTSFNVIVGVIPEPGSLMLMGAGLTTLTLRRRRRS